MNIIDCKLKFKPLSYGNKPNKIILHHAKATKCSIYDVHRWHLNMGWAGCGYHFFISKDGVIYRGRVEDAVGAHCKGYNKNSLGVCMEGDYTVDTMPETQSKALLWLLKYLCSKYYINKIYGHREFISTACPGMKFPLDTIRNEVLKGQNFRINCCDKVYPGYLLKMNANKKDDNVRFIQEKLIKLGYNVGAHGADGYFGRSTYDAVVKFQRENGLLVDGIVGMGTWKRIMG